METRTATDGSRSRSFTPRRAGAATGTRPRTPRASAMSHSQSTTSTPSSLACEPAAQSSLARWSATKTATGSATSAAPRGSSSSWRSRSAEGSGRPVNRLASVSGRSGQDPLTVRDSCGPFRAGLRLRKAGLRTSALLRPGPRSARARETCDRCSPYVMKSLRAQAPLSVASSHLCKSELAGSAVISAPSLALAKRLPADQACTGSLRWAVIS